MPAPWLGLSSAESRCRCRPTHLHPRRVHYRLAAYAYKLYKGLLKQQGSRETVTRQAVLRAKIQQLDALQQQLDDRQRRGLVKKVNNAWDPVRSAPLPG